MSFIGRDKIVLSQSTSVRLHVSCSQFTCQNVPMLRANTKQLANLHIINIYASVNFIQSWWLILALVILTLPWHFHVCHLQDKMAAR